MNKTLRQSYIEEEARLLDEAVSRAYGLGRPFEEQEVFQFIWEQGIELHPALDDRFQLHQEGRWQGRGEKKKFIPRLWVVRQESDSRVAIRESLDAGECTISDLEATITGRRLSVRATAQVDSESGELELCTENGIECFTAGEALELRELLNSQHSVLYALANQN